MAQVQFTNNAYTTLAVGCAAGDGTLTVTSSSTFPSVTTASGNWFYACLQDTFANLEIVKVTNVSGTTWTVTRAIGGTSARAFASGAVVELRLTAETLTDIYSYTVSGALQNSTPQYLTSVTGTDTITASLTPALTAYAAGQKFHFIAAGANTTTAPTININSLGAKNITKLGSAALSAGDIASGAAYILIYDGTQFQLTGGAGGGGAVANNTLLLTQHNITSSYAMPSGSSGITVGPLSVATGQSLTVPTGEAVVALSIAPTVAPNDVTPITTGAQTIYGQKTFNQQPNIAGLTSMVRLYTANGYGSSSTVIRRFSTVAVNQGSDITYNSSTEATLGATFTINTSGVYHISYSDAFNGASWAGLSLNSTQLTTAIPSINIADVLCFAYNAGVVGGGVCVAWAGYLPAGSVIRPHSNGVAWAAGIAPVFTITRVA